MTYNSVEAIEKFKKLLYIIIERREVHMMAPVPVQAACNTILCKAFSEHIPVSPMKLQKLLYFSYRQYLRNTNGLPLFSEQFEAWPYGPVLRSVYDEFKSFHGDPITMFAKNANGSVSVISCQNAPEACRAIDSTWELYKNKSGIELSQITHLPGSAWHKAMASRDIFLKNEDIQREDVK